MCRMVLCKCGTQTWTDTTDMQMWSRYGMRAIVCSGCHKQNRTGQWRCECQKFWHRCRIHSIDPLEHRSARVSLPLSVQKDVALLPTSRKLPVSHRDRLGTCHTNLSQQSKRRKESNPVQTVAHFGLTAAACPKLAKRFARTHPHLFKDEEEDEENVAPSDEEMPKPPEAFSSCYRDMGVFERRRGVSEKRNTDECAKHLMDGPTN